MVDIKNPKVQRERLFAQEPRIMDAVHALALLLQKLPADPAHPKLVPRALLVGGFVRDALRGDHPKDADVEVYGVTPERLEAILDQHFSEKVNKVGRAFGVFKVAIAPGIALDVSIPRRESKSGTGHKAFIVDGDPAMSVVEAAQRRDFTINAIAADPLTGEVLDYFHGVDDLRNNVLRATDPERFQDDPLRVYRAVQFVARMKLHVEPSTVALMKTMVAREEFISLSPERVTEEWKKLFLKSDAPSHGFALARELGIIERLYPELHALIDTPQEKEWHPEGDVWTHTMMVIDIAAKISVREKFNETERLQTLVGGLCHDLGKPLTTTLEDGRIRSLAHEEAGRAPTRTMLARHTFGEEIVHAAEMIATEHLKPAMLHASRMRESGSGAMSEAAYVNAIRKLVKRIHPLSWRVLVAAAEADARGRGNGIPWDEPYAAGVHFRAAVEQNEFDAHPVANLVQGEDILRIAKEEGLVVEPGPVFGKLIGAVEAARDVGTVTTKEEGLTLLRQLLKAQ